MRTFLLWLVGLHLYRMGRGQQEQNGGSLFVYYDEIELVGTAMRFETCGSNVYFVPTTEFYPFF